MKKIKLILLVSLITLTAGLHAADVCTETATQHLELVGRTETYLASVAENSKGISSFEITQIQKKLTARFLSLKNVLATYENAANNCAPTLTGSAIAIHDFTKVRTSIFANTEIRRAVLGFVKYKPYQLTDFVNLYEKYTSDEFINNVQQEMIYKKINLPYELDMTRGKYERDPNINAASDTGIKASTSIVAGLARVWGFVSDKTKWRQGHLNKDPEARALALSHLKPLDLVYEKRTFVLSNYTIPGHWGHVGIWLGTKEELIELGVWDQDYFLPFKKYVEAGQNIVEIRKEGIVFQSIDTFMNLDEFAITRINGITNNIESVFEELTQQIGKKYDFKFDARSADKITCAELIAFSYGDIKWHQTKTLFQVSLRPDDLAVLSLEDSNSSEFVLYLKGNKDAPLSNFGFAEWSDLFAPKKH